MQSKIKKIIKYVASLLVAAVLLYFSFRGIDWADFISVLRQCRWGFVALSMFAGFVAYVVRALRWRLMLMPSDPGVRGIVCYDAFAIGKIADYVLPHVGEFVRCGVVAKNSKVGYDKTLGSVLLERSWDIVSLFVVLIVLLALKWEDFGAFFMEKIWNPILGRMNIWLVLAIVAVVAVAVVAVMMSAKVKGFLKGLWTGIVESLKMKGKGWFLLLTVLLWVMFLMICMTIIWALPEQYGLGLSDGLFIMLVGALAGLVPVPGGFGAFHYLVSLTLLTLYGIPFEMGIVFATLSHESQALMAVITGGVAYINRMTRKSQLSEN